MNMQLVPSCQDFFMRDREFDDHVRQSAASVSTYARSLTSDRNLAEDAVQETFLRAWKYLDSYTGQGSFEGWLIRICRNCVIDLSAKKPTHEPLSHELIAKLPVGGTHSGSVELQDLIERLPTVHREVLVLVGVLGYDYEFAAELLAIPVGTVRSRLSRAREALQQMLANADHNSTESASA
jgi:RNA polymerase sigma-70 factor, ECF subfamily